MRLSLVICTRNRAGQLKACLEAVGKMKYAGSWELVVVDNGSTDETQKVLDSFRGVLPLQAVYLEQPGLGRARNAGVKAASGDVFLFTDDDCYVVENLLEAAADLFRDPTIGYAGGRILLYDESDARVTVQESLTPREFMPRTYIPAGAVHGANMAFRREALDSIGGFDPDFGSGAQFPAEDIDAVARASLAGWRGVYAPELVVYHHHGRKDRELPKLRKTYDIGRGAYHAKLFMQKGGWRPALIAARGVVRRASGRIEAPIWEFVGAARYLRWRLGNPAAR